MSLFSKESSSMFKAATSTLGLLLILSPISLKSADTSVAKLAEEESVRRQEASILLRKTLANAEEQFKKKDYNAAAKTYEEA